MSKRILSIVLFMTLSFPTVRNLSSLLDYAVRYDHYKTVLCENKERPELKCNGKCQLALEQKEQDQPQIPTLETVLELDPMRASVQPLDISWWISISEQEVNEVTYYSSLWKDWHAKIPVPPPRKVG